MTAKLSSPLRKKIEFRTPDGRLVGNHDLTIEPADQLLPPERFCLKDSSSGLTLERVVSAAMVIKDDRSIELFSGSLDVVDGEVEFPKLERLVSDESITVEVNVQNFSVASQSFVLWRNKRRASTEPLFLNAMDVGCRPAYHADISDGRVGDARQDGGRRHQRLCVAP